MTGDKRAKTASTNVSFSVRLNAVNTHLYKPSNLYSYVGCSDDLQEYENMITTTPQLPHYSNPLSYIKPPTIVENIIGNFLDLKPSFPNPTKEQPQSLATFLGALDCSPFEDIFARCYGSVDYHYRHPMTAMIKAAVLRRVAGIRSYQKLVNRLKVSHSDSVDLGFKDKLPARTAFWDFESKRIDVDTLTEAMDAAVRSIRIELSNNGVKLGRRVAIDSTPLEGLLDDKDARANKHYKIRGYKIHGVYCLDTNIPLAIFITPANDGDGPKLVDLLNHIHGLGIEFEEVFADGAYSGFENFALVCGYYGARFITNIRSDAVISPQGTMEKLKNKYHRYWANGGFDKNADLQKMCRFLIRQKQVKLVGAYFRNIHLKVWMNRPKTMRAYYNKRNMVEGFHGFVKKYLHLRTFFDRVRGHEKVEHHVRWVYFGLLAVCLTRAQNGVTERLTEVAWFE